MPWVRLDDAFPDHRKLAKLSAWRPLAGWLYVLGLAYCNRQLTDGRIPKVHVDMGRLDGFTGLDLNGQPIQPSQVAEELIAVGLWEEDEHDYIVHDYADYQPTARETKKLRRERQESGRVGGYRKAAKQKASKALANSYQHAGKEPANNIANDYQDASNAPGELEAKVCPVPVPVPVPLKNTYACVPDGEAGKAWEQWRKSWELSGRTELPITPSWREVQHLATFAERYPDAGWRAKMLDQFFTTERSDIRRSVPSLGWFLHWAPEVDMALREAGFHPSSEAVA